MLPQQHPQRARPTAPAPRGHHHPLLLEGLAPPSTPQAVSPPLARPRPPSPACAPCPVLAAQCPLPSGGLSLPRGGRPSGCVPLDLPAAADSFPVGFALHPGRGTLRWPLPRGVAAAGEMAPSITVTTAPLGDPSSPRPLSKGPLGPGLCSILLWPLWGLIYLPECVYLLLICWETVSFLFRVASPRPRRRALTSARPASFQMLSRFLRAAWVHAPGLPL